MGLRQMHSPDEISYNSAIHSCANARPPRIDEAESLFREMVAVGFQPTASTFTALERAIGYNRSSALCSSLGVDPRRSTCSEESSTCSAIGHDRDAQRDGREA